MYCARVCRCETGGCCPPTAAPARPNVCRWCPRRPRRPVCVDLRTARATTQSSHDRPGATGSQGSSGPHRTSRCAASPSGTVLWRRSVWASSRLREMSVTVPAAVRLAGEPDHQFDRLYRWLDHTEAADVGPGPTSPSPGTQGAWAEGAELATAHRTRSRDRVVLARSDATRPDACGVALAVSLLVGSSNLVLRLPGERIRRVIAESAQVLGTALRPSLRGGQSVARPQQRVCPGPDARPLSRSQWHGAREALPRPRLR